MAVIFQTGGMISVATKINPSLFSSTFAHIDLYPVTLYNNMTDLNVTLDDPLLGTSIAASFVTDSSASLLWEIDFLLIR